MTLLFWWGQIKITSSPLNLCQYWSFFIFNCKNVSTSWFVCRLYVCNGSWAWPFERIGQGTVKNFKLNLRNEIWFDWKETETKVIVILNGIRKSKLLFLKLRNAENYFFGWISPFLFYKLLEMFSKY